MAGKRKKKNFEFLIRKFPKRMQKKLVLLFMATILAFLGLIAEITHINADKGSRYTKIVLDQQQYDSRVIPYKRGDIVDRSGTKLATSERVYNVILDAYVLLANENCVDITVSSLESVFGIAGDEVRAVLEENPDGRYNILKYGVSYDAVQQFYALEEEVKKKAQEQEAENAGEEEESSEEKPPVIKGIWMEDDYKRTYPYNTLASDVIGFSVSGNQGAAGIESAYNDVLNGTDGREYGYFSEESSIERTVKPAKNGSTIVSTIDLTLQSIVEQCIREFNDTHEGEVRKDEPGSNNTAVIIMDPNTGEILAEASYPNFNLNEPRKMPYIYTQTKQEVKANGLDLTYIQESWKKYTDELWNSLSEEEQLNAMNAMWRNFCVSNAYEPGSTAKPFTVAAGLESGKLTGEESYYCNGYRQIGPDTIYCHLHSGHGAESFGDTLANSCNVAMMEMAETIGAQDFSRYQHIFGFGEYNGIDLPGEAYTAGLLYDPEDMKPVDLGINSFGQGFNVTMTQMVAAFSSLINGGYYYEPHVVRQIEDSNGKVIETKDPILLRKTVSKETSEKIKQYLKGVVDYGTGSSLKMEEYDLGGKTGTAEKLPRSMGNHLLSFIGYAPQENPEVVIYVVIDQPNVPDQTVSKYVLDLTKRIISVAFPHLDITTTGRTSPPAPEETTENTGGDDTSAYSQEDYTSYDVQYEDPYSNPDGAYVDETYDPDLDDWAFTPSE